MKGFWWKGPQSKIFKNDFFLFGIGFKYHIITIPILVRIIFLDFSLNYSNLCKENFARYTILWNAINCKIYFVNMKRAVMYIIKTTGAKHNLLSVSFDLHNFPKNPALFLGFPKYPECAHPVYTKIRGLSYTRFAITTLWWSKTYFHKEIRILLFQFAPNRTVVN